MITMTISEARAKWASTTKAAARVGVLLTRHGRAVACLFHAQDWEGVRRFSNRRGGRGLTSLVRSLSESGPAVIESQAGELVLLGVSQNSMTELP
jgi:hypothetical protein